MLTGRLLPPYVLTRIIGLLGLAAFAVGCGQVGGEPRAASATTGGEASYATSTLQDGAVDPHAGYDEFVPDWDDPIAGVAVETLASATSGVAFEIVEPKALGEAVSIFVSSGEVPRGSAVVAFVYDTDAFGRVIVVERLPESTPDEYEKFHEYLVSLNGDPLVHGRFDLVEVRPGIRALITTSEDGSRSVGFWLEGGVEFIVEGPALSFDQVVEITKLMGG